ncbi:MAG: methyltransferase [Pseudomonadota bacterium]
MPLDTAQADASIEPPQATAEKRPPSLTNAFKTFRRKLVANPSFRAFAQKTPLLRSVASSSANDVFALTSGFINSQILLACAELNLFETLSDTERSAARLAQKWDMTAERALRLLQAAEGIGLIYRTSDGKYGLDEHGIVIAQSPGILAMVRHHRAVYRDLADPVALLRAPQTNTETSQFWSYVGSPDDWGKRVGTEDADSYSTLMRLSQQMVIEQVLGAYPVGKHHSRLIDVGGGNGAFVTEAASRWDALEVGIFDLPPVADNAGKRLAESSFNSRLTIYAGSFFEDAVPHDADCYSLMRVLYDHNDDAALSILRNVRSAMNPGDTLIIGEPMAGDRAGERLVQAYFGFYLLAMQSGKCRTAKELQKMLMRAGFRRSKRVSTALPVISGLVVAQA